VTKQSFPCSLLPIVVKWKDRHGLPALAMTVLIIGRTGENVIVSLSLRYCTIKFELSNAYKDLLVRLQK